MSGNLVLKRGVAPAIFTTVGATTLGFDSLAAAYPSDFLPISGASAITLTLPAIRLTSTALGAGDGQQYTFLNLAAQSVVIAANAADTLKGSTATLTQNAAVTYTADATNKFWYRDRA